MKVEKAAIKIKSTINGDEIINEYNGEYAYENGVHNIAYSDYTGTDLTKKRNPSHRHRNAPASSRSV